MSAEPAALEAAGPADDLVGARLELDIGAVAHGGFCVARHEGRVVFVRHALPGERVRALVTEGRPGDRYLRADAVEVLTASPDRVEPPCPYAGPGRCGGCDWQHAELGAQRRLKAAVVQEQLRRLAGIERAVTVEPVPGDRDGLGWRTRVRFAVDGEGRLGLHKSRSAEVVPVDRCRIAAPELDELGVTAVRWPGADSVEVAAVPAPAPVPTPGAGTESGTESGTEAGTESGTESGTEAGTQSGTATDADGPAKAATKTAPAHGSAEAAQRLVSVRPARAGSLQLPRLATPASLVVEEPAARAGAAGGRRRSGPRPAVGAGVRRVRGRSWLRERAGGRSWRVGAGGFWQVHPGAADLLVDVVLDGLEPRAGESALDLYAGVGLFAGVLAQRLGPAGRVVAVESDPRAVADARRNLHDLPTVSIVTGRVQRVLAAGNAAGTEAAGGAPPAPPASPTGNGSATGAGPADTRSTATRPADPDLTGVDLVVLDPPRAGAGRAVVERLAALGPRRIAYVACDPAALARDLATFAAGGYDLLGLRAFDLFPMTAHVECVAILGPAHGEPPSGGGPPAPALGDRDGVPYDAD